MKKIISLLLCMVMAFSLVACGGSKETAEAPATESKEETVTEEAESKEIVAGMIAYTFGTQSYSDDILAALEQAEEELGVPHYEIEIADVSETANGFRTLIQQGCNFVIASSAEYCDGMLEVAAEYPDVYFLYLAARLEDAPANVMSFEYREQEASFLAGALAGLMTKSNKIGAVLAMAEPLQLRYQYGYTAGAKAVNPDCEVMITFTNSYADTNIGYEHANAMYTQGCDFVGCYAGACNLGVFQAGLEAGDGAYCFGAATGQFDKCPEKIVASVTKPVADPIIQILSGLQSTGELDTSISTLGLAEEGVKLLYTTENDALLEEVPEDVKAAVAELEEMIISGQLEVPGTEEEYNAFTFTYGK